MKHLIFVVICFAVLTACSNSSSDSNPNAGQSAGALSTSIDGTWVYVNPSSTESAVKGLGAVVSGSKISLISMYIYQQSAGYKVYFRRNEGTFVKDGERLTITYTYQTCGTLGTEDVYVKINGENAVVNANNGSLVYTMKKYASNDPNSPLNYTMIEDKGCTILSKLQRDKKVRSVASDDIGSIFLLKNLE